MDFATKKKQAKQWLQWAIIAHRQSVILAHAASDKEDLEKQITKKQIINRPFFIPKSWGTVYPCIFTHVQHGFVEWPDDNIVALGPQETQNCPNFYKQCDCKYAHIKQAYFIADATHTHEQEKFNWIKARRRIAFCKLLNKSHNK